MRVRCACFARLCLLGMCVRSFVCFVCIFVVALCYFVCVLRCAMLYVYVFFRVCFFNLGGRVTALLV